MPGMRVEKALDQTGAAVEGGAPALAVAPARERRRQPDRQVLPGGGGAAVPARRGMVRPPTLELLIGSLLFYPTRQAHGARLRTPMILLGKNEDIANQYLQTTCILYHTIRRKCFPYSPPPSSPFFGRQNVENMKTLHMQKD